MKWDIQWLGKGVSYKKAMRIQVDLQKRILEEKSPYTLLNLEHSPIYTGKEKERVSNLPYPFQETNRGGKITYHGPGQLVSYPLIALKEIGNDLHLYLRILEESMILLLEEYGVLSEKREGFTGVWVEGKRKIAFIGIAVRRGISSHGFSLNLSEESLPPFNSIIPCGIEGIEITSLFQETGKKEEAEEIGNRLGEILETEFLNKSLKGIL